MKRTTILIALALLAVWQVAPVEAAQPLVPQAPWAPGAGEKLSPLALPGALDLPPEIERDGLQVTLPQVIDMALRNSPLTRASWLAAHSAAAEVGSKSAAWWPKINLSANGTRQRQSAGSGQSVFELTSYGPGVDLSFLLFDFGGRQAEIDDARATLLAADWQHNQAVQDLVLSVERAYYRYLTAMSLRDSLLADIRRAETTVSVAEELHRAGLATIADVLQAKTQLERQQLALVRTEGQMKEVKGALAIVIGLPPDIRVEPAQLPEDVPATAAAEAVREDLQLALGERPDLQAVRAQAIAAEQRVTKARSDGLPTLSLAGNLNRVYYENPAGLDPRNNYSAQLLLRYPLFTGRANHFDIAKAKAEAELARTRVDQTVQQVTTEVWTAYYELESSAKAVEASRTLVDSARQSAEVAEGRYKAGVGSILDLLTAQAALADARAQEIQARADWFTAVAQLAYDAGVLTPPAAPAAPDSLRGKP